MIQSISDSSEQMNNNSSSIEALSEVYMDASLKVDEVGEAISTGVEHAQDSLESYSKNSATTEKMISDILRMNDLSSSTSKSIKVIKENVDKLVETL